MTKESLEQYCFKKSCNCETHQDYTRFNEKLHIDEDYKIKIRDAEYCVYCDTMILENYKKICDIIKKKELYKYLKYVLIVKKNVISYFLPIV